MTTPRTQCRQCNHWRWTEPEKGECRRLAPVPGPDGVARWPVTSWLDWCADADPEGPMKVVHWRGDPADLPGMGG